MDLDESILQNQYILVDMEKELIKYIYCIVLDDSSFLFTSDIFSDVKIVYKLIYEYNPEFQNCHLVKINSNYFDPTNFEQSYKYFEEI